jgi:hypothetical protein
MRFLAVLVLALVSISSASAETWQRSIVDLFKETCTVPDTPTAMMAAGDQLASSHSGRLDQARSGRSPFAVWKFTDSSGEPFFINKIWEFSLRRESTQKCVTAFVGS